MGQTIGAQHIHTLFESLGFLINSEVLKEFFERNPEMNRIMVGEVSWQTYRFEAARRMDVEL